MAWYDYVVAPLIWVVLGLVKLTAALLGLVMVPLGLIFTALPDWDVEEHTVIRLPFWCHPWDNVRDGAMGDKRMWYWNIGYPRVFNRLEDKAFVFMKCYYWLAIRNPANRISRYYRGMGCPVDRCNISWIGQKVVKDKVGYEGLQFVKASGAVFNYYGFYHVVPCPQIGWFKGRYFVCRIGHKIEPKHATADWTGVEENKRWKGFTFRPYLPQRV